MDHYLPCSKVFMCKAIATVASLLLLSSAALADDAALLHCRGMVDAAARLACYDALPLTGSEPKAPQSEVSQRNAPPTPEQFGLEDKLFAPPRGLDTIESQIPGRFEGWQPGTSIRLANGQVWQVVDGSSRVYDVTNPKITITRRSLGSFYLNLEGDNRTVRVRRIQ